MKGKLIIGAISLILAFASDTLGGITLDRAPLTPTVGGKTSAHLPGSQHHRIHPPATSSTAHIPAKGNHQGLIAPANGFCSLGNKMLLPATRQKCHLLRGSFYQNRAAAQQAIME
ncbi:MAG: hypothetical protein D6B25_03540 [Desulfobulbaceae bacterium]|nr:MAG: hypothetical protein D6B25_03540 [Desulfobulbaceae bacterium]